MDKTDWVERYAWFGVMKDMQGVNEVSSRAHYGVNIWIDFLLVRQNYGHQRKDQRSRSSIYRRGPSKYHR